MSDMTVSIAQLGALGDGIAEGPAGRIHIPFTAPGDLARIALKGKDAGALIEVLTASPERVVPPCGHFGRCGGCALQHIAPAFTADWKRSKVIAALARSGLGQTMVAETLSVPAATRRRATLAASRIGKRLTLGFAERASHQLVDLRECPVSRPDLVALFQPIRVRLGVLLNAGETADIALTWTETGVDLVVIRRRPLNLADREALADLAETADLAKVSWRASVTAAAEPVAARRTPLVRFGDHMVALPPGVFLQPSIEGERLLTTLILDAISGTNGPIADLFAGLGTFTIPASRIGPVTAFDGDKAAISALRAAARGTRISADARDLFREPLTVRELNPFAAAIIDPPRAGAQAQTRMLADSAIPLIAFASCNPVSFARDAAILTDGGYRLEQVTPVDQFLWSSHIELVGIFRR